MSPEIAAWLEQIEGDKTLIGLQNAEEQLWLNPDWEPFSKIRSQLPFDGADIDDAAARLKRFAPLIEDLFPETRDAGGIIESPLVKLEAAAVHLAEYWQTDVPGKLFLKSDNLLPISGSIKARGGIYEVLKHAEELALSHGLLTNDYRCFNSEPLRELFSQKTIVVGSTGNLGLSIGIMGRALGFNVTVHMSADARAWKKARLRSIGAQVVEHASDYSLAVESGRKQALGDPDSYFIDDEDSVSLLLGYSVAAERLKAQLDAQGISVDSEHPLIVHLPCGVGGGPGGVAFGLKQLFGDNVFCFFAEPTQSPCMLLSLYSGLSNRICVQDVGLSNQTCADGLAVARSSALVASLMRHLLDGVYTVEDDTLFAQLALLKISQDVRVEPSAAAGMGGFYFLRDFKTESARLSLLQSRLKQATQVVWATGGQLVPEQEYSDYLERGLQQVSAH